MARFHSRWDVLIALCRQARFGVEVGVAAGRTTDKLLAALPELSLVGVDSWRPYSEVVRDKTWHDRNLDSAEHVRRRYPDRLKLVHKPSLEAAREFDDGVLDFVFIDADHRYEPCLADIRAWAPKVRAGGLVIGHDYDHPRWPGVRQAVAEIFGDEVELFSMSGERCRVWLHRK